MYVDGLYTPFSSCRNLNKLYIKCQSYSRVNKSWRFQTKNMQKSLPYSHDIYLSFRINKWMRKIQILTFVKFKQFTSSVINFILLGEFFFFCDRMHYTLYLKICLHTTEINPTYFVSKTVTQKLFFLVSFKIFNFILETYYTFPLEKPFLVLF